MHIGSDDAIAWNDEVEKFARTQIYLKITGKRPEGVVPETPRIGTTRRKFSRFFGIVVKMYFGDHPPPQ